MGMVEEFGVEGKVKVKVKVKVEASPTGLPQRQLSFKNISCGEPSGDTPTGPHLLFLGISYLIGRPVGEARMH